MGALSKRLGPYKKGVYGHSDGQILPYGRLPPLLAPRREVPRVGALTATCVFLVRINLAILLGIDALEMLHSLVINFNILKF
jgi:hypothetical protein